MEGFDVMKAVGKGKFGIAYLARPKFDLKQLCIIKQMNVEDMTTAEKKESLMEVEVLRRLQHPNIVAYKDHFIEDNMLNIVMEFASDGTLGGKIKDSAPDGLDESVALRYFVQCVLAVEYVHAQGILHRDIKPENIFMSLGGIVKLGDFGIAKMFENKEDDLAKTSVGTPYYLSPEVVSGKSYGRKSDVWALGVVLYELCSSKRPFRATNIVLLANAIYTGKYEPLPPRISPSVHNLCTEILSKNADDRPSCSEILQKDCVQPILEQLKQELHLENAAIAAANIHVRCAYLYVWGNGSASPRAIEALLHKTIVGISVNVYHAAAVTEDGSIYAWTVGVGHLQLGELGLKNRPASSKRPLQIRSLQNVSQVSLGRNFSLCVTSDGAVYSWGSNTHGQLGRIFAADILHQEHATTRLIQSWSQIDNANTAMRKAALALRQSREVNDDSSPAASPSSPLSPLMPQLMLSPLKIQQKEERAALKFAAQEMSSLYEDGLKKKELLMQQKREKKIQKRMKDLQDMAEEARKKCETAEAERDEILAVSCRRSTYPIRVDVLEKYVVKAIATGSAHACALTAEGKLFCWGDNSDGQLGLDHKYVVYTPKLVERLRSNVVIAISCGGSHTLALSKPLANDTANILFSWGDNSRGQLGHGDDTPRHCPEAIKALKSDSLNVVSIACGEIHCAAIVELPGSKSVYVWGASQNVWSSRDSESADDISEPFEIRQVPHPEQISCGLFYNAVITSEGTLFMWGFGTDRGQLGHFGDPWPPTKVQIGSAEGNLKAFVVACGHDTVICSAEPFEPHTHNNPENGHEH